MEEERSLRPIPLNDVVNITNDGLLITSSGHLYDCSKNKNMMKTRMMIEKKISNAQIFKDCVLVSDEKGNVHRYKDNLCYSLISESSYQIVEISVGISHALFRTSSGLVLAYGTCIQQQHILL